MKNFDVDQLVLLNPRCAIDAEARKLAKHAEDLLEGTRVVHALPPFDLLVATTARQGTDYNLPRTALTPRSLGRKLAAARGNVGILFGPEDAGLTNEELKAANVTVTIPSSSTYASLNLAQSVTVILYELFLALHNPPSSPFTLATNEQQSKMKLLFDEVLETVQFDTPEKKETQRLLWRNITGRSMLTKREAQALLGLLKKLIGRR